MKLKESGNCKCYRGGAVLNAASPGADVHDKRVQAS